MSDLFSSFSPEAYNQLPLNWMSVFIPILLAYPLFWLSPSLRSAMLHFVYLNNEKSVLLNFNSGVSIKNSKLFSTLLTYLIFINYFGLFPYIFTSSSHMVFTMSVAFPLWAGYMALSWASDFDYMSAHLVPAGSPLGLSFFMVGVELVSNIIRPLTLSVRLCANMIAGHLLLILISGNFWKQGVVPLTFIVGGLSALLFLESAVSVIQAYVFSTLGSLYYGEADLKKLT